MSIVNKVLFQCMTDLISVDYNKLIDLEQQLEHVPNHPNYLIVIHNLNSFIDEIKTGMPHVYYCEYCLSNYEPLYPHGKDDEFLCGECKSLEGEDC